MEHPEPLAQLLHDLSGLLGGEQGVRQQKVQGVPLDKLLNDQILSLPFCGLVDQRQVGAGAAQQPAVYLSVPLKAAEDKQLSRGIVPDQPHAAPGAFLRKPDLLKFAPQLF